MTDDAVVIIDSSEDEEPSKKKIKIDDTESINIHISSAKSVIQKNVAVKLNSEIVIIDDEDDIINEEEKPLVKIETNGDSENVNGTSVHKLENGNSTNRRVELITLDDTSTQVKNEKLACPNDDEMSLKEESVNNNEENNLVNEPLSNTESIPEFDLFLETCSNCECNIKHKELILKKIPSIKQKYKLADADYIKSKHFKHLLNFGIEKIKRKPANVIILFNDLYRELSARRHRNIELTERENRHLKSLYKVMIKVSEKINELESQEVNWDDESNSVYIMTERYKERFCNIYKKICSFTKENFYASRYLYSNLDISSSTFKEINRAIDKFYNKTKQFPSYYDVDQCIRKCVQQNNITINEAALEREIKKVFLDVGHLLQRRRKREHHDWFNYVLELNHTEEDPQIEALMDQRHIENNKRIDAVIDKFVGYQENGEDPSVSSDSDDSIQESNDEETN